MSERDDPLACDPLVRAFEDGTMPPEKLRHREHVEIARRMLRALPFEEGAPRFVRALRRFAAANRAPEKFHATVTWAYLAILSELLEDDELRDAPVEVLVEREPMLRDVRVLAGLWPADELASDRARRAFVLPRRPSR